MPIKPKPLTIPDYPHHDHNAVLSIFAQPYTGVNVLHCSYDRAYWTYDYFRFGGGTLSGFSHEEVGQLLSCGAVCRARSTIWYSLF